MIRTMIRETGDNEFGGLTERDLRVGVAVFLRTEADELERQATRLKEQAEQSKSWKWLRVLGERKRLEKKIEQLRFDDMCVDLSEAKKVIAALDRLIPEYQLAGRQRRLLWVTREHAFWTARQKHAYDEMVELRHRLNEAQTTPPPQEA